MKKSERLAPVLKLESMREQDAIKSYVNARSRLLAEQSKLQQLIDYSREYQAMIELKGREGISATQLHSLHQFLHKLSGAITQQQKQLLLAEEEAQQKEKHWFRQRGAAKNMEKLVARHANMERVETDKKEQKEFDEQAQQISSSYL